jgi:hypothetical protein
LITDDEGLTIEGLEIAPNLKGTPRPPHDRLAHPPNAHAVDHAR